MVLDDREKAWQRLLSTPIPFRISSIRIIESDIFAPQTITLERVMAIIGSHGTGKSLFLRMLEAVFGYVTPHYTPPFVRDGSEIAEIKGIVEVELKTPSGIIHRQVDLDQPESTRRQVWTEAIDNSFEAWYVSPVYLFSELFLLYQDFLSFRDRAASGGSKCIKKEKLRTLNNILGRSYDRVEIYPDIVDDDQGIYVPYISARIGDRIIDTALMSQGELWVHYVLDWFLEDGTPDESLFLLDEPETFLAARAERPFIDQVARQALSKSFQLVIATHSPETLARFPLANIRLCVASDDGIRVVPPRSVFQIRESVGIRTPIRMLLLVEDELAKDILSFLFARYDGALVAEVEIVPTGGEGQVKNGVRILQHTSKLACLGVLDGDKRNSGITDEARILFLPGTSFPEDELVSAVSREPAATAVTMNATPEDIFAAVSSCLGLDHQYWIKTIAAHFGFPESIMIHELVRAWLTHGGIEEQAVTLIREIRSYIP
jgi:hypothetical protein